MTEHPAVDVPDRLFDDAAAEERWRARFGAKRVSLPRSARDREDRSIYLSNASGTWEIYAWDRAADTHRQVTDRPNGTYSAALPPDGADVWWFADTDGDEFGRWVREPFTGGAAVPAVDGVPDGYPAGLELGSTTVAVGTATDKGSTVWVAVDGGPARTVYEHQEDASVGALSRDETLVAISHSEHGDSRHPAIRVLRLADDAAVAEKWDGEGKGLQPLDFSPVAGDQRLLATHERRGREELLVWDVATDVETEIVLDLPGELEAQWHPDGSALLVGHTHAARTTMHRYDFATGDLTTMATAAGTIASADVRGDGSVEYSWSSAASASVVRVLRPDGTDEVLLTAPGATPAPPSVAVEDAWVDGPGGRVHALVAKPAGVDGPLPTVFFVHGGPQSADEDRFSPARAAYVDAGFAVVNVNYRGSTGYGSTWRDAIEGRPGLTELEDIAAVHDWAVSSGLTDPARVAITGYSWGGYLTLLALGTQPERWAVGVAGVPVADYVAAYEDEMEPLRAFDRALFGGSPADLPELYERCSPLTYVDAVRAPVLVLAGENDPRCPIRQIDNYLDALAARKAEYAVYRYDAGHGSLVVAETLKQMSAEVAFVRRTFAAVG